MNKKEKINQDLEKKENLEALIEKEINEIDRLHEVLEAAVDNELKAQKISREERDGIIKFSEKSLPLYDQYLNLNFDTKLLKELKKYRRDLERKFSRYLKTGEEGGSSQEKEKLAENEEALNWQPAKPANVEKSGLQPAKNEEAKEAETKQPVKPEVPDEKMGKKPKPEAATEEESRLINQKENTRQELEIVMDIIKTLKKVKIDRIKRGDLTKKEKEKYEMLQIGLERYKDIGGYYDNKYGQTKEVNTVVDWNNLSAKQIDAIHEAQAAANEEIKQAWEEYKKIEEARAKINREDQEQNEKSLDLIEDDFEGKILKLEKVLAKPDSSSLIKEDDIIFGSLVNGKIEKGKPVILDNGWTTKVISIKLLASGKYRIETRTSFYDLAIADDPNRDQIKSRQKETEAKKEYSAGKQAQPQEELDRLREKIKNLDQNSRLAEKGQPSENREEGERTDFRAVQAEKEKNEKQTSVQELKRELERARYDYLKEDRQKKKARRRVWGWLTKFARAGQDEPLDFSRREKDLELAQARANYDNKLFQYKNAVLAEAREKGASGRELADVVRFFEMEAKINLADAYLDVKRDRKDEKLADFLRRNGEAALRNYERLSRFQKLLIGALFTGAAVSAYSFGTTAAALVGTAVAARRAFLGVVTGVGATLLAEKITRRNIEKKIKEDVGEFQKGIERLSPEEKFRLAEEKIKRIIYDDERAINQIKNKKLRNLALGAAAGVAAAGAGRIVELVGGEAGVKATAAPEGAGPSTPEFAPEAAEAVVEKVTLEVEQGGSLEGALIEYVKNHQAEIYEHHPELKNFDPGQIAHRMHLDYLHQHPNPLNKSLDLVYPGAKIEINPAALQITEVSDSKGTIGRLILQVAGDQENWSSLKNLNLTSATLEAQQKILDLSDEYARYWGPEAQIQSEEKVRDWVTRVARLSLEKNT